MNKLCLIAIPGIAVFCLFWFLREPDPVRHLEAELERLARNLSDEGEGMIARLADVQEIAARFSTNAVIEVAGGSRSVSLRGRGGIRQAAGRLRSSGTGVSVVLEPLHIERIAEDRMKARVSVTVWEEGSPERKDQPLLLEWRRTGRRWLIERVTGSAGLESGG